MYINYISIGNSLAVQWLGLHAFTAMGPGLIPGWGTILEKNIKKDDTTLSAGGPGCHSWWTWDQHSELEAPKILYNFVLAPCQLDQLFLQNLLTKQWYQITFWNGGRCLPIHYRIKTVTLHRIIEIKNLTFLCLLAHKRPSLNRGEIISHLFFF